MPNRLTTAEAQEFVDHLTEDFSKKTKKRVPRTLVKMKTSYETWAGICYPSMIYVNRGIMKDVPEPFVKEILAHELAHHIMDSIHFTSDVKYQVHGKEWKSVAKSIGAFPLAFHFYPIAPFIMNNMDRFWCYENDGEFKFLGADGKGAKGVKFWSNGKLWRQTDRKKEGLDFLDDFEKKHTKKEIERRLKLVSTSRTFWRHYER
jgi:predicted SprT family Zn-dependent metalloprotease